MLTLISQQVDPLTGPLRWTEVLVVSHSPTVPRCLVVFGGPSADKLQMQGGAGKIVPVTTGELKQLLHQSSTEKHKTRSSF